MDLRCLPDILFKNTTSSFQLPGGLNGSYQAEQNLTVETEIVYGCPGNCNDTSLNMPGNAGAYIAVLNCCIFLTGIVGNVVAIVVVARYQHMRTSINFYLVNLSVADLCILLVCQPVAIVEFFNKDLWPFGEFICKLVPIVEHTVLQTSVLTIFIINFERSNAICRPLSVFKGSGRFRARLTIPLTWLVSFFLSLPFVGITEVQQVTFLNGAKGPACISRIDQTWKQFFVAASFLFLFFVPVLLMTVFLMKAIQKLRSSNNFRVLYERSCRSSLVSVFSRSDISVRDSPYQRMASSKCRRKTDSTCFEDEIPSNIIEEESEQMVEFFSDSLINSGDSRLLPQSTEKEKDVNTDLPKPSSWTYEPWSRLPNLIEDVNEDCADYADGPKGNDSPLKYCSTQVAIKLTPTNSGRKIGLQTSLSVDFNLGRGQKSVRNSGARTSVPGADTVRNIDPSIFSESDSNQYRRSSLSRSEERRLSLFFHGKRSPKLSQNWGRSSSFGSCSPSSHRSQIKILIAIFLFFVLSNAPVRIFILFQVFAPSSYLGSMNLQTYFSIFWTLRIIMYLHSAANPMLYFLMSSKFSEALKTLIGPKVQREKNAILSLPMTQLKLLGLDPMEKTNKI